MVYPAWFALHDDNVIADHPTASRVYARLLRLDKIFLEPHDVKAWLLAEQMGCTRKSVGRAIRLLIARGYVVEHAPGFNNVFRLTLAIDRAGCVPQDSQRTSP